MHERSIHLASSSTALFALASSWSPWIWARRCVCTRKTLTHQKIAQSRSSEHQLHHHETRLIVSNLAHWTVIRLSQTKEHRTKLMLTWTTMFLFHKETSWLIDAIDYRLIPNVSTNWKLYVARDLREIPQP